MHILVVSTSLKFGHNLEFIIFEFFMVIITNFMTMMSNYTFWKVYIITIEQFSKNFIFYYIFTRNNIHC